MLITTVQMLEARSTGQRETRPSIRPAGFEPATDGLENRCSILLSYGRNLADSVRKRKQAVWHTPISRAAPGRIRTCGLRFRKPPLYPPELRAHSLCPPDSQLSNGLVSTRQRGLS